MDKYFYWRKGKALVGMIMAVGILGVAGCTQEAKETSPTASGAAAPVEAKKSKENAPIPETNTMTLVTSAGEITIELDLKEAPRNASQVKTLAARGFYDGTGFHRVMRNTMIQGGCPNTKDTDFTDDGKGEAGTQIPYEDNGLPMTAGAVAMAHGRDRNSASSQFFICVSDCPKWKGQYTVIGRVTKGLEIARTLSQVDVLPGNHPKQMAVIKEVLFEEKK